MARTVHAGCYATIPLNLVLLEGQGVTFDACFEHARSRRFSYFGIGGCSTCYGGKDASRAEKAAACNGADTCSINGASIHWRSRLLRTIPRAVAVFKGYGRGRIPANGLLRLICS